MRIDRGSVSVFIAEEQELLRDAYPALLEAEGDAVVVAAAVERLPAGTLASAVARSGAGVLVVGMRTLNTESVAYLQEVRERLPLTGMLVLSFAYDARAVQALRDLARYAGSGCGYLLKQTVGSVGQLVQAIIAVAEGRVIIDPGVMDDLVRPEAPQVGMLRNLTRREMEVLGWMSRGYRNAAIARILHLEPKTGERHINNIYGKLGGCPEAKHPRVQAIGLFLGALGSRAKEWQDADGDDGDYPSPASSPRFQPSTASSRAMEGSSSRAGTAQAIPRGTATFMSSSPGRLS
jgi:DNA-binding NarL/FixJ family response regulator